MDAIDRESLKSLSRNVGFPCVSLYMPTHRAGGEKEQDPIRLRNLVDRAASMLAADGMRAQDIESLLAPLRGAVADPGFWRGTAEGLAAFVSRDNTSVLRLDTPFAEAVSVGERFSVRQLIPAVHSHVRFWLLALSKNSIRLFAANYDSIAEVLVPGAPTSFKEAMKYEDAGHGFQFHPESPPTPTGARGAAVYYGGGGLPDAEKDQVERFVRLVDRAVEDVVRNSGKPLLLAGVEYEVALYRAVNSYPLLADRALLGNFDETPVAELHAAARIAIGPSFADSVRADLAELEEKAALPVVSDDLREIVAAAHEGRVKTLFVDDTTSTWGKYDAATGSVEVRTVPAPGDWDLSEIATSETLLHGGDVHVLTPSEIPADATLAPPAAILRY